MYILRTVTGLLTKKQFR